VELGNLEGLVLLADGLGVSDIRFWKRVAAMVDVDLALENVFLEEMFVCGTD
jgi:hypothetical protein